MVLGKYQSPYKIAPNYQFNKKAKKKKLYNKECSWFKNSNDFTWCL